MQQDETPPVPSGGSNVYTRRPSFKHKRAEYFYIGNCINYLHYVI